MATFSSADSAKMLAYVLHDHEMAPLYVEEVEEVGIAMCWYVVVGGEV